MTSRAMAVPLAPRRPVEQIKVICLVLDGYARPDFSSGSSTRYEATCSYSADGLPDISAWGNWSVDYLAGEDTRTWLCSEPERTIGGEGQVRVDGQAILSRYSIDSCPPIDTASIVMLVVSMLGLILTFVLIRRPSRVRPMFDVIRIFAIVGLVISSAIAFSPTAPVPAVAGAIVAFGAGLVVTQITEVAGFGTPSAAGAKKFGNSEPALSLDDAVNGGCTNECRGRLSGRLAGGNRPVPVRPAALTQRAGNPC